MGDMGIDWARLAALDGLITEPVGKALARVAGSVFPPDVIVEIGSYKGKSTAYLAAGSRIGAGALVVAVDPWDLPGNPGGRFGFDQAETREAFERQLEAAGVRDAVEMRQMFSVDAARRFTRPIGLLYIDGSHTYSDVRADWLAWSRHLGPDSVVAFDDYGTPRNPGVTRLVDELIAQKNRRWVFDPAPLAIGIPQ